jgi:hypothetical protein
MAACSDPFGPIINPSERRAILSGIVYIPQQPSRYEHALQLWIPSMNLKPAEKFGRPLIMLPPNLANAMTAPLVEALKEKMANFDAADYLVAVGDPTLIAAAAGIALRKTGGTLNLLKWDKQARDYINTEIRI